MDMSVADRSRRLAFHRLRSRRCAIAAVFFLWLLPSIGFIHKFTGQVGVVVIPLLALAAIIAASLILSRSRDISPIWLFVLCGVSVLLFALLYPVAESGLLGRGSDRDEALDVALEALLSGRFPYYETTYLGNTPTPMPGALLLALPFYLAGDSAFQNLFWVPFFFWWCVKRLASPLSATFFLLIFFFGCPASLRDFVTGGDYFVNWIYVAIAMDVVIRAQKTEQRWVGVVAAIFLGLAVSSRPIYFLAVPILAGVTYKSFGARRMIEFVTTVAATSIMLNAPFLLYDFSHFPSRHLLVKLPVSPQVLGNVLPLAAAAVACLSFAGKLGWAQMFGLMAASLAVIFYTVLILEAGAHGLSGFMSTSAAYSLPVTLFGGLWIWKEQFISGASPDTSIPPR